VAYIVDFGSPRVRSSDPSEDIALGLYFVGRRDVPRVGDGVRLAGVLRVAVLQGVGYFQVFEDFDSGVVVADGCLVIRQSAQVVGDVRIARCNHDAHRRHRDPVDQPDHAVRTDAEDLITDHRCG
jgi:hypothetical protein